jgi:hypothetical protein
MDSRKNLELNLSSLLMTAALAGTSHSADIPNEYGKGLSLVVDLTTVTTGTVTVTIEGKDAASGKYYTLLASTALAAAATTRMLVYPGATASNNVKANDSLPATFRVTVVIADSGGTAAVTGTIGGTILQ